MGDLGSTAEYCYPYLVSSREGWSDSLELRYSASDQACHQVDQMVHSQGYKDLQLRQLKLPAEVLIEVPWS